MNREVKMLGNVCLGCGLFLFGVVKLWLPVVLIVLGIIFIIFSDKFHFEG